MRKYNVGRKRESDTNSNSIYESCESCVCIYTLMIFYKQKMIKHVKLYTLEDLKWNIIPWRFGSDHFPFFSWLISSFQPLIFQGVHQTFRGTSRNLQPPRSTWIRPMAADSRSWPGEEQPAPLAGSLLIEIIRWENQLRLVVSPIIYRVFSTSQTVVGNGISEASTVSPGVVV